MHAWALTLVSIVLLATVIACGSEEEDYWPAIATILRTECSHVTDPAIPCRVLRGPNDWVLETREPGEYRVEVWLRGMPQEAGFRLEWLYLSLGGDAEWFATTQWAPGPALGSVRECEAFDTEWRFLITSHLNCEWSGSGQSLSGDVQLAALTFTRLPEHPRHASTLRPDPIVGLNWLWSRADRNLLNDWAIPPPDAFDSTVNAALQRQGEADHELFRQGLITRLEFPAVWMIADSPSTGLRDRTLVCDVVVTGHLDRAARSAVYLGDEIREYVAILLQFPAGQAGGFLARLAEECSDHDSLIEIVPLPERLGSDAVGYLVEQDSDPLGAPYTQLVALQQGDFIIAVIASERQLEMLNLDQQIEVAEAGVRRLLQVQHRIPTE